MQISTHELIKLMAEVANREVGAYIEKEKQNKKPKEKTYIVTTEVTYEFHDLVKDVTTYSMNIVTIREGENPVKKVINHLTYKYIADDITLVYDPISRCYRGIKAGEKKFVIGSISDKIIDRYEV